MKKGIFIVCEGGEGSGKDTQIELLKERPELKDALFTREPGGTEIGNEIRALVLKNRTIPLDAQTELFLFCAARSALMNQVIRPALRAGRTVISNRFELSTYAYQIYARERPDLLPLLKYLSHTIVGDDKGDESPHYIFFDVSPDIGKKRVESRGLMTHFDSAPIDFHTRVRKGYLEQLPNYPKKVIINADQSVDVIAKEVWQAVSLWLREVVGVVS